MNILKTLASLAFSTILFNSCAQTETKAATESLYDISIKSLEGDVITDAFQDFGQFGGRPEITMKMNALGAKTWKNLTGDNIGSSIAIVLDNLHTYLICLPYRDPK